MNIVFLCGSIEPGCDGVGDYTRRLAEALILLEHKVSVIALDDKYVSIANQEIGIDAGVVSTYRIPTSFTDQQRCTQARHWIDQINPDMVSLQFVIYSFHKKGLPFGLKNTISRICNGRSVHIMFHETWLGVTKSASFKDKAYGFFQKQIISSLVKNLKPRLITTTNGLYKTLLKELNITAKIIPLFSNIPIATKDAMFIRNIFSELELDSIKTYYIAGIFGNIYNDSNLREAIIDLEESARVNNKKLLVLGFGKISGRASSIFQQLKLEFLDRMFIKHLGEFDTKQLSNLIQILDVAISPTPAKHIGKSGVYAALRLHDKKVIIPNTLLFPEYEAEIIDFNNQLELKSAEFFNVSNVAKDFSRLICQSLISLTPQQQLSTAL